MSSSSKVLCSQKTEIKCIKTITATHIKESTRLKILGLLSSIEYFHYPPCKSAYTRIMVYIRKKSEIITFDDLLEDPSIEKDFREILANSEIEECGSKKEIRQMLHTLEKYRKIRAVYNLAKQALDSLNEDKFDIDNIIDNVTSGVTKARQITSDEDEMCIIGSEGNASDTVHDALYGRTPPLLKTGYNGYDSVNGGLPKEGVMLIAATTSGGKSTMLLNLLKNLYLANHVSVCKISLEMSTRQETNRLLSNLSGIHYTKFVQGLLSKDNKKAAEAAYEKFNRFGEKNGCRFASISPEKGMSIDDIFITMKPYGFNVIGIDYVSLLKGVSTDNQWRILGDITAQAKLYSRINHCLVIILAQLDDESDKLRYSKAMRENADILWHWNYSKEETRKTKILDINVGKARDGELLHFALSEQFEFMRIENPSDDYNSSDDDDGIDDDELTNVNAGVS